ncbi:hypothetical protein P4S80_00975 [Aeribacillus composti]|uniref:hypothetical protein n=1 Tax=Aeribacillus composti TaxID=1868734 RepID=UPI002E1C871D|nr:hypothetical protein [Aeribacillus composti]
MVKPHNITRLVRSDDYSSQVCGLENATRTTSSEMKHQLSVEGFLNMDSYALYSFFRLAFDWLQFNFFLPDWYDPDELPRL